MKRRRWRLMVAAVALGGLIGWRLGRPDPPDDIVCETGRCPR